MNLGSRSPSSPERHESHFLARQLDGPARTCRSGSCRGRPDARRVRRPRTRGHVRGSSEAPRDRKGHHGRRPSPTHLSPPGAAVPPAIPGHGVADLDRRWRPPRPPASRPGSERPGPREADPALPGQGETRLLRNTRDRANECWHRLELHGPARYDGMAWTTSTSALTRAGSKSMKLRLIPVATRKQSATAR